MFRKDDPMKTTLFVIPLMTVIYSISPSAFGAGTEDVGNAPLSEANYRVWKGIMPVINDTSRVYHTWVNGNEHFYYRGDDTALDAALLRFAATEAPIRELIIRPGPGKTRTFDGTEIEYDWLLHIQGGISKHEEKGTNVWDKHPTMTVFVGGGKIELDRIEVPTGLVILELADLRARYLDGLKSEDSAVRGYAAYFLARIGPHNRKDVHALAKLLDDEDDWVRLMAAGALGRFGECAEPIVPVLRNALRSKDETDRIKNRFQEAIG